MGRGKLRVIFWDGVHLFKRGHRMLVCVGLISLLPKAILNGPYLLSIKISTLLEVIQDSEVYRYFVRLRYAVL